MTVTVSEPCLLDAVNIVYRGRFHIRLRRNGAGKWDAVSIIDGAWFQNTASPEEGMRIAMRHIDALFLPST